MKKILNFNRILPLAGGVFIFLLISCDGNNAQTREVEREVEEIERDSLPVMTRVELEMPLQINYHLDSLASQEAVDSLFANYSEGQLKTVFAINRIEKVRVGQGTKLIIPDTIFEDISKYSPFLEKLHILDSIPKVVLIAQRIQAFALYENGSLIRWGAISGGKQSTPTPNGLHYGNYKAKRKISTVNKDWILPYYFNFMNFEGVGVHQYLLPGFPASHACVRLYMEDAQFIYDWANMWKLDSRGARVVKNGTPFMVFGDYDFEGEYPWLLLDKYPESNRLNDEEYNILREYVQTYMKDERNFYKETREEELIL